MSISRAGCRAKGHNEERAVARDLRDHGFDDARRGLQYQDGVGAPDVIAYPYHIEVKRQRQPNIRAALRQAVEQCPAGQVAVAVTREDRGPRLVTMLWADWIELAAAARGDEGDR